MGDRCPCRHARQDLSFSRKRLSRIVKVSKVEDDGYLAARPAFAAYAAPCQHRGRLHRKVATYLPLFLVLECAWPSIRFSAERISLACQCKSFSALTASLCRARNLRFLFGAHGFGGLENCFGGLWNRSSAIYYQFLEKICPWR